MNRRRFLAVPAALVAALVWPFSWVRGQIAALRPRVAGLEAAWEPVPGATGYEILVDGRSFKRVNRNTLSAVVPVGTASVVAIVDLPRRTLIQEIDFEQRQA